MNFWEYYMITYTYEYTYMRCYKLIAYPLYPENWFKNYYLLFFNRYLYNSTIVVSFKWYKYNFLVNSNGVRVRYLIINPCDLITTFPCHHDHL